MSALGLLIAAAGAVMLRAAILGVGPMTVLDELLSRAGLPQPGKRTQTVPRGEYGEIGGNRLGPPNPNILPNHPQIRQ